MKIQNITIGITAVLIVSAVIAYSYSVEQTKQKGQQFGNELDMIQKNVGQLQAEFYSEKTKWEEGDITKEQLLEFYDGHLADFMEVIAGYGLLDPPELFSGSVELLRLSSEKQMESDRQFIEWIKTGNESARIRSDANFQESVEYELLGLVEFYSAKTGVKNYDERKKFEAPQSGLTQTVIYVYKHMEEQCNETFRDESGGFVSNTVEAGWSECIGDANAWKTEHLP